MTRELETPQGLFDLNSLVVFEQFLTGAGLFNERRLGLG